jgi:hypothetical protein
MDPDEILNTDTTLQTKMKCSTSREQKNTKIEQSIHYAYKTTTNIHKQNTHKTSYISIYLIYLLYLFNIFINNILVSSILIHIVNNVFKFDLFLSTMYISINSKLQDL